MILRNARLGSRSVDLRIENGSVTEIGSIGSIDDESVDLDGRWLTAGLWDHHVHFSHWALQSRRLDVSSAGSASETARQIGEGISVY
jgi:dihydroorotase-like cyclic amidohydrolase